MNAEDFQQLYKLLRGSKSAFAVLDARTLFLEKKLDSCLAKMQEASDAYRQSRTRLMRQDPEKDIDPKAADADRQKRRLKRKQDKVREIFGMFDEMLPKLDELVKRAAEKQRKVAATTQNESDESDELSSQSEPNDQGEIRRIDRPVTPADVSDEFAARFLQCYGDRQLELISRSFGFRPVEDEEDIYPNAVYFIKIKDESFLVHTRDESQLVDSVPLVSAVDQVPMKTYTREAFVRLGMRRRMVLLTTDAAPVEGAILSPQANHDSEIAEIAETLAIEETVQQTHVDLGSDSEPPSNASAAADQLDTSSDANQVLDMGDFSQLMDSAQRSGLVPNADQVAYLRDREFRLGRYDMAFSGVEALFASFTAAAAKRTSDLAREEQGIKSGSLKMSPKDLQAKRIRDRQQDQEVERARGRFQRVLNGLQILISQQPSEEN